MTRDEMHRRISELKAENLPGLTWRDLLTDKPDAPLSEANQATLNEYFQKFVATPTDDNGQQVCLCCRSILRSGIDGALLGGAPGSTTLEWSMTHGEAHCRVCGWPYRVYHYDIGGKGSEALIERLNVALAVHPALVEPRAEKSVAS